MSSRHWLDYGHVSSLVLNTENRTNCLQEACHLSTPSMCSSVTAQRTHACIYPSHSVQKEVWLSPPTQKGVRVEAVLPCQKSEKDTPRIGGGGDGQTPLNLLQPEQILAPLVLKEGGSLAYNRGTVAPRSQGQGRYSPRRGEVMVFTLILSLQTSWWHCL